jgi:hypothetical protein
VIARPLFDVSALFHRALGLILIAPQGFIYRGLSGARGKEFVLNGDEGFVIFPEASNVQQLNILL